MLDDKAASDSASPPTQRVVSVIELLAAARQPCSSAAIADALGLSRSTVGAILAELGERGWVSRGADLTYEIGTGLMAIAECARDRLPLPDLYVDLDRLAAQTGCGAALSAIVGGKLTFIAVAPGRGTIPAGIKAGSQLPLIPPAGASVVAFWDAPSQGAWLDCPDAAEQRHVLAQVLADVREFGVTVWSLNEQIAATLQVLTDVVGRLSESLADNALRERILALFIHLNGHPHDRASIESSADLSISHLTAPVFDPDGTARWELQIGPLRPSVTKAERDNYIEMLTASARHLTKKMVTSAVRGG